jgi:hypothetical protein
MGNYDLISNFSWSQLAAIYYGNRSKKEFMECEVSIIGEEFIVEYPLNLNGSSELNWTEGFLEVRRINDDKGFLDYYLFFHPGFGNPIRVGHVSKSMSPEKLGIHIRQKK